ncbi:MAG: recombinase family protein [Thaumarchaeota archaeon]|nr:recombinase family protein [Nitrososphaerota archaeon]
MERRNQPQQPEETKPYRVIGYIRVSSDEQKRKGLSPQTQREALQEWADERGWVLLAFEEGDVGHPAEFMNDLGKREGLTRILALQKGSVEAVIVTHTDRISRDAEQTLYIQRMLKNKGIDIWFMNVGLVDYTTPLGKSMLTMSGMYAENEKRTLSIRSRSGKRTGKKLGRHQGRPPLGYTIDPKTKVLIPIPEIINEVTELFEAGYKPVRIAEEIGAPKTAVYGLVHRLGLMR